MQVSAYLRSHTREITELWESEVKRMLAPLRGMARAALIDHLPELIVALADWIDGDVVAARAGFRALVDGHALQRLGFGIDLETLTVEYSQLRHVILRELLHVASNEDVREDLIRLDEAMDLATHESVRSYAARREAIRERFIAILAHDLRSPLAAVLTSADVLLRSDVGDDKTAALGGRVRRSAERMQRMIDSVVDFARGHLGGGIPSTPVINDMGELCRAVADEVRAAFVEPELRLEIGAGDLRGPFDADRVQQALGNLLGNARQYGVGAITLAVRASDDGKAIITSVHNHGRAIPETFLPTLFDPFARGESANRKGLGLGLFIVNQIALAHGATCSVASSEEGGTTFAIRWPRALAAL